MEIRDVRIVTEEYIIAYIDLLGSTEKIKNDTGDIFLNHIYSAYTTAFQMRDFSRYKDLKVKIFSDNIVIALSTKNTNDGRINACGILLEYLMFFQMNCLLKGYILLNGCVSIGNLYIDETIVWGNGLLNAYSGELRANYPRIIIDPEVLNLNVGHNILLRDFDGEYFIDYYLTLFSQFGNSPNIEILADIYNFYKNEINANKNKSKIMQKLNWQIDYHNKHCIKKNIHKYCI